MPSSQGILSARYYKVTLQSRKYYIVSMIFFSDTSKNRFLFLDHNKYDSASISRTRST